MKFAGKTVNRLPDIMRSQVARSYLKTYQENYVSANKTLTKLNRIIDETLLDNQPLRDHFNEQRLLAIAETKAEIVKSLTRSIDCDARKHKLVKNYVENVGIEISDELRKSDKGLVMRACNSDWWRRQLRKVTSRSAERLALSYGLVSKKDSIYCSDFAVARFRAMKKRNRQMMENTILTNESGAEFTLQELSDKTTANPSIRRGELMTRIRGFEEYAKYNRKAAVFITITAPSHYHARSYKFSGATPRDTQHYLNTVWSRVRAAAHRRGIELFGFRVAEPHHDGTPHFHALLFVDPNHQSELVRLANYYSKQEDGTERGAHKHRCKVEFIDSRKGSAASYIAKYISKNIDGFGVDNDLYGFDAASSAERISSWASLWGIRQFQQIGGLPVTVWRTLRRIDTSFDDEEAEAARNFADSGDWDLFMRHGQAAGLELYKIEDETVNEYGEPAPSKILGVLSRLTGEVGLKVTHVWELRQQPWTRVNNCTSTGNLLEETNNRLEKEGFGLPPPSEIH